jgi:hypothetical protein
MTCPLLAVHANALIRALSELVVLPILRGFGFAVSVWSERC